MILIPIITNTNIMLQFVTPAYGVHHRSHPCHYAYAANQLLSNFFNTNRAEAQRSGESTRDLVVKQYEDENCHQIQLFKRFGDFSSYEISLVRKAGDYIVKVSSDLDQVQKCFSINKSLIDISGVDYKWYHEANALVVNLPKKHKHEGRSAKKEKLRERRVHKQKKKQERRLRKELRKRQAEERKQHKHEKRTQEPVTEAQPATEPEHRTEAQPVSGGELWTEAETPETSDFETPSETSDNEDLEPLGHSHSPTMEEVEDEEFVLLRKKFE